MDETVLGQNPLRVWVPQGVIFYLRGLSSLVSAHSVAYTFYAGETVLYTFYAGETVLFFRRECGGG